MSFGLSLVVFLMRKTRAIFKFQSHLPFLHYSVFRYCYLLSDLTPELLGSKCSSYEELQDYLHLRGREAYLKKRVSFPYSATLWNLCISQSVNPNIYALKFPLLTYSSVKEYGLFCFETFSKRHLLFVPSMKGSLYPDE